MKRINSMVWGTVLLLVGIVLTLSELGYLNISGDMTLPIILLVLGVVFHLYYFLSKMGNEGLLVPGGILLVYGLMFILAPIGGVFSSGLWPLFILGPALGLLELYVFSHGKKGSLASVVILAIIGGAFLLIKVVDFGIVAAIILIGFGLSMMINAMVKSDGRRSDANMSGSYTVNGNNTINNASDQKTSEPFNGSGYNSGSSDQPKQ